MEVKYLNLIAIILTLVFWGNTSGENEVIFHLDRTDDSEIIVSQFINAVNAYCEEYDAEHQFFIQDDLLIHPSADIANDIPGIEEEQCQANDYLFKLKRRRLKVKYEKEFRLEECLINGQNIWGATVEKEVIVNGEVKARYTEFIELAEIKGLIKVKSIFSSLFPGYSNINCDANEEEVIQEAEKPCPFLSLAEAEFQNSNHAKALEYYQKSLACGIKETYINTQITLLNTTAKIEDALNKANRHYDNAEFNEAQQLYKLVKKNKQFINEQKAETIDIRIKDCQNQIEFLTLIKSGDHFLEKKFYDKALPYYEMALKIFPQNTATLNKQIICNKKIKEDYSNKAKTQIAAAQRMIERGNYIEGMKILMKYRQSGFLSGLHLFYMAQIIDTEPRKIKKKFKLSNYDCCVLARQYIIQARNKGYESQDFDYFWNEHFNKKSRKCD